MYLHKLAGALATLAFLIMPPLPCAAAIQMLAQKRSSNNSQKATSKGNAACARNVIDRAWLEKRAQQQPKQKSQPARKKIPVIKQTTKTRGQPRMILS